MAPPPDAAPAPPPALPAPAGPAFRIAGFVHDAAEGAALDDMARVAAFLARLSRARAGSRPGGAA